MPDESENLWRRITGNISKAARPCAKLGLVCMRCPAGALALGRRIAENTAPIKLLILAAVINQMQLLSFSFLAIFDKLAWPLDDIGGRFLCRAAFRTDRYAGREREMALRTRFKFTGRLFVGGRLVIGLRLALAAMKPRAIHFGHGAFEPVMIATMI